MLSKRKHVTLSRIVLVVFIFASVSLAAGFMNVITPETPRMPALVLPQTTARTPRLVADYPLALGDTWVYQSTRYEGFNPSEIMTATSTITETVVETKTEPDYYAARVRRETSDETPIAGPPDLQKSLARAASSIEYWLIVAGDRVYHQDGAPDLTKLQSTDGVELVFPLKPDARWVWLPARLPTDQSADGVYRQVLKVGNVRVPAGQFDNCFLIQDGWVTDTVHRWFCPGVGWVEMKGDHNGTPFGSHMVLLRYQLSDQLPAPATGQEPLLSWQDLKNGCRNLVLMADGQAQYGACGSLQTLPSVSGAGGYWDRWKELLNH